jgi:hypothetical protein
MVMLCSDDLRIVFSAGAVFNYTFYDKGDVPKSLWVTGIDRVTDGGINECGKRRDEGG